MKLLIVHNLKAKKYYVSFFNLFPYLQHNNLLQKVLQKVF